MPRFAANLTMMFNEVPFLDRFEAAAKAGFTAVEFLFPYDHPADEVGARLKRAGLTQALFNLPPGDWAAGEKGFAALPDRFEDLKQSLVTALPYAKATGVKRLHLMAGIAERKDPKAVEAFYKSVAWAAEFFAPWWIATRVAPEHCAPLLESASHLIIYHYVVEGDLRVRIDGDEGEGLKIEAGEVILLPRNDLHLMGSDLRLPPVPGGEIIRPPRNGGLFSIHHGGGVGIGYSQHAGMVVVCDGSADAARRLERVLWNDPATGVMRHADAGYESAIACANSGRVPTTHSTAYKRK